MSTVSTAIVLCAGRGKRLIPYTDKVPKPLLPVAGKPTLDFILESLKVADVENIVLVTHHLAEQIQAYASQQTFFPQQNITCVEQQELAGTADAALSALDAKSEWFSGSFILSASDYLVPQDFYKSIIDEYKSTGRAIAVSLKRLPDEELAARSSVRFDQHGDVLEVVEKPAAGTAPSNLSANLVYVLPSDIVPFVRQVETSARGEKEIQTAINRYLVMHGPACGLEQDTPAEWTPDMQ